MTPYSAARFGSYIGTASNLTSRKSGGRGRSYNDGYKAGRFDQVYDWEMPTNSWYHLGYQDGQQERLRVLLASGGALM
jgi:hypothetical protein